MKVIGIDYKGFLDVLTKVQQASGIPLKFTVQGTAVSKGSTYYQEKVVEGKLLLAYKCDWSAVSKDTGKTAIPCAHAAFYVVKTLLQNGATEVWYEKTKVLPWSTGLFKKTTIAGKLQAKGYTCNCPEKTGDAPVVSATAKATAASLVASASKAPVEAPAPEKPKVKGSGLDLKPLDGPAFTDGDIGEGSYPKSYRDAFACVTGLYVLAELDKVVAGWRRLHFQSHRAITRCDHTTSWACEDSKCPESYDPLDGLPTRILAHRHTSGVCPTCHKGHVDTMARANACKSPSDAERILVNGGLASYREEWRGEDSENYNVGLRTLFAEYVQFSADYKRTLARNLFDYLALASVQEGRYNHAGIPLPAIQQFAAYDPRTSLPYLEWLFLHGKFSGGFGGKKWSAIAKGAGYYFQFSDYPVVFADHVVDLTHNGNVLFNKGYILYMDDSEQGEYIRMLDHKREHSILDGTIPLRLTTEVYLMAGRVLSHEGKGLRNVKAVVADKTIKTVKWGSKAFTFDTVGSASSVPDSSDDEDTQTADSPNYFLSAPDKTRV